MSKYNVFTTKAGFKETQTRDEDGKWSTKPGPLKDRPCFKEWFKDSKVVDGSGEPREFFHGTTHDFNEFSKERGNVENDFGIGFYFSSDESDVISNYDDLDGADLRIRISRRMEEIMSDFDWTPELSNSARAQATSEMSGGESRVIPVYLSVKNPVVIGAPVFHAEEKETYFDYDYGYNSETDEYGEETGALVEWAEAVRETFNEYENNGYGGIDYTRVISDVLERGQDYGGIDAKSLVEVMKTSEGLIYSMDENGAQASGELIRGVFENMGFDGIIDNTVFEKFGIPGAKMEGLDEMTQHVIAFEPGSIKRSDAKTFCHETDIRKSVLVNGQVKAGFKETQQRDAAGKWSDKWAGMKSFEQEIKDRKKEKAGVYDENGNQLETFDGDEMGVEINKVDLKAFLLTHNHPNDSSLSRNDTLFMLSQKFREIRAIGPNGKVYKMSIVGDPYEAYIGQHFRQIETDFMTNWKTAQGLADQEVVDYVYNKYKDVPDLELNWQFKDKKIKEAQELFGRYSDRVNWHVANSTEFGNKFLKYETYD